jgi:hypothetical protein
MGMNNQNIPAGRRYYLLAVLVFVAGCVLFGWFLYRSLNGLIENLTRAVVPGKAEITLSVPGTYTVFYEYRSVLGNNKIYSSREGFAGLECTVTSKASDSQIPLSRPSRDLEYSFGDRKGIAVLEFAVEKPGAYEFSCRYPGEQQQIVLALGHRFTDKLVGKMVLAMVIFLISAAAAVAIALRIFFKRQEASKKE